MQTWRINNQNASVQAQKGPPARSKAKDQQGYGLDLELLDERLDIHMNKMWDKIHEECRGLENRITTEMRQIESKISDVIASVTFNANNIEKVIKDTIPTLRKEMKDDKKMLEEEIDRLNAYNCRENLVFIGIPEEASAEGPGGEDVKKTLQKFYKDHLKMDPELVKEMKYQRVHRLASTLRPRPIKARFVYYGDRELIMSNAKYLKGSKMYISEDLPIRIRQKRKAQMEVLKVARGAGKLAYFSRTEPSKLFVDRVYLPIDKQAEFLEKCRGPNPGQTPRPTSRPIPGQRDQQPQPQPEHQERPIQLLPVA